jgi:hypothetical protein
MEHEFEQSLDHTVGLCNGLASKLLTSVIIEEKETNEPQILLSFIVEDLLTIVEHDIIEFPIAIVILKTLIL